MRARKNFSGIIDPGRIYVFPGFLLTIERYNIVTNRIDLDEKNTSIKNLILSQIMYNDIIGIRFMDWRKS